MGTAVILPDFILKSRQNQIWTESGLDTLKECLDKKHFKSYPYPIEYRYNSRGFRDAEWPDDIEQLQNAIWCVGDSFTVGQGSPLEHTWPYILQQKTGRRTINVSLDGASNKWIARKIKRIAELAPKIIIAQWSYIHRSELDDDEKSDEDRRLSHHDNKLNNKEWWETLIDQVHDIERSKKQTRVIHSFVPNFADDADILVKWEKIKGTTWPDLPNNLTEFNNLPDSVVDELTNFFKLYTTFENYYKLNDGLEYIPEIQVLDRARDGFHYDRLTAQTFVGDRKSVV
jgi:hypothetical protein